MQKIHRLEVCIHEYCQKLHIAIEELVTWECSLQTVSSSIPQKLASCSYLNYNKN